MELTKRPSSLNILEKNIMHFNEVTTWYPPEPGLLFFNSVFTWQEKRHRRWNMCSQRGRVKEFGEAEL